MKSIVRSVLSLFVPAALSLLAGCSECEEAEIMSGQSGYTPSVRLTVSVQRSSAAGTVTSQPAGIDCTPSCWAAYSSGTDVTLTAQANEGWVFDRWEGDCTGPNASTSVKLDYNKVCDAIFRPVTPPPAEDAGTNESNGENDLGGGICCAPADTQISLGLCDPQGEKCCTPITALECKSQGGKWMDVATCKAAGPSC